MKILQAFLATNAFMFSILMNGFAQINRYDGLENEKKILIGLDASGTLINVWNHGGFTIEPVVKYIAGPNKPVLSFSLGYCNNYTDSTGTNLINYRNKGVYCILGIETRLKNLDHVKFTGGFNLVFMGFKERGSIYFENEYFGVGKVKFSRDNNFGFGLEIAGNLYIPVSHKIKINLQTKLGKPFVNYNDVPFRYVAMDPPYYQGMGYQILGLSINFSVKVFYRIY